MTGLIVAVAIFIATFSVGAGVKNPPLAGTGDFPIRSESHGPCEIIPGSCVFVGPATVRCRCVGGGFVFDRPEGPPGGA